MRWTALSGTDWPLRVYLRAPLRCLPSLSVAQQVFSEELAAGMAAWKAQFAVTLYQNLENPFIAEVRRPPLREDQAHRCRSHTTLTLTLLSHEYFRSSL